MEWLTKLLGVEAPQGTTLTAAELGFRGLFAWWLAALIIVAFAGFAFVLYFNERGRLGLVRRVLLGLLRTAVLVFLLLLLFRPFLLAEFAGERPRSVAILLDNSQSMKQADQRMAASDRLRAAIARGLVDSRVTVEESALLAGLPEDRLAKPTRLELVQEVLQNDKLKLLDGLRQRGPVQPYLFGEHLRSVLEEQQEEKTKQVRSLGQQLAERLNGEQSKTALADAIMEILSRKDGDLPGSVVVVTDGRDNASKYLLAEASSEAFRAGVPLHIYGVGSTEGGSLHLLDMNAPSTIFYDDNITVPLRWRSAGFKKGTVQLKLLLDGKVVAEKELPVRNGTDLRDELTFTPRKEGDSQEDKKAELKAIIAIKGNEQFKDQLTRTVRLSDSKVRILYIENTPRWEYKFMQAALLRDRRIEARFILVGGDPRLMESGPPFLAAFPKREELLKYDLLILGDVPASYLNRERMELIQEFVRDFRGGLIQIAGRYHAPSSFENTPLAEVLPVEFLPYQFRSEDNSLYQPQLTQAGETAEMLALADTPEENRKVWESLPGFYWNFPVLKLRPAATALLVHPRKKTDDQPMPIMAMQYYGKGQVLFMASDETWRWRYNTEDKYYTRFWGQVIYQLALPHLLGNASSKVQVALERSEAILNRPGSIYVRLLDEEFRPRKDKEVPATLTYLDAQPNQPRNRQVLLQAIAGRPGEYRVFLENDQPGRFELRIRGSDNPFQYRVNLPPRHELEESGLAEEQLREAARVSGGDFYREEDLYRLVDNIQERKTPFTLRQEILLWNPLVFLLFIGLITTEWIVRKFANLS